MKTIREVACELHDEYDKTSTKELLKRIEDLEKIVENIVNELKLK